MKHIDISSRDYGRLLDNSEYYRVTYPSGFQVFLLNGMRHRDDGGGRKDFGWGVALLFKRHTL